MNGILAAKLAVILAAFPAALVVGVIVRREVDQVRVWNSLLIAGAVGIAIWSALMMTSIWLLAVTFVFGVGLFTLGIIDALAFRLPDLLTFPLIMAGLAVAFWLPDQNVPAHFFGAAAGFLVFCGISLAYRRTRGREGLGLGDAKLAAGAGAWLGWEPLPVVILIASAAGLLWFGLALLRRGRTALTEQIPFGVPLCMATWLVWLYGIPAGIGSFG